MSCQPPRLKLLGELRDDIEATRGRRCLECLRQRLLERVDNLDGLRLTRHRKSTSVRLTAHFYSAFYGLS